LAMSLFEGLHSPKQAGEEGVGVRNRYDARTAVAHEVLSVGSKLTSRNPIDWITAIGRAQECRSQCVIPLPGPTADDQTVFVKNLIKLTVVFCRVVLRMRASL